MKLLLLTKDLSDNSTGRAQVLWSLAQSLGWDARVVAPKGDNLWLPARGTEFEENCEVVASDLELERIARDVDLVIAVKPLPGSFGRAVKLPPSTRILLDIDDPDIESILGHGFPLKALAKSILRAHVFWSTFFLSRRVKNYPVIVSNPVLQERFGGEVVPHARADTGNGAAHESATPRVVFVGTNRRHKGIDVLRAAVRMLADKGVSLTVTDDPPSDAQDLEEWIGQTTIAHGLSRVKSGDIVVIPSMPEEIHSLAQLPAKLIDAMIAGRAIVVADFAPLRWAVGETGLVFQPGSPTSLACCLSQLCDPVLRARLGKAARDRALAVFTIEQVQRTFEIACTDAVTR